MSWLFSRALVAEFSAASNSGGAQSALSSSTPTPRAFLPPDKTTDFSRPSRFGMTFGPLTDGLGAELLTWFLEDSRARTSALPGQGGGSKANAPASGQKWRGSLAKYDPATSSWKTAQLSLLAGSTEYAETWPRWGTTVAGELYLLPTPERLIGASASGLWQTPIANDAQKRGNFDPIRSYGLAGAVKLWPTPTASLGTKGGRITPRKGREGGTLIEAVSQRQTWPTPVASMAKGSSPAALTRKCGRSRENDRLDHKVMATNGGQLNPTWVEWLMGWPLGWTDLQPLETDKYPMPQPLRGAA